MARLREDDTLASLMKYGIDNWPDPDATIVPTAHEAWSGFSGTAPEIWAAFQPLQPDPLLARASESRYVFPFRVLTFSRKINPWRAHRLAADFADLFHNSTFDIIDRTDGTTKVGDFVCNDALAGATGRDDRGVTFSFCDVPNGWAYSL